MSTKCWRIAAVATSEKQDSRQKRDIRILYLSPPSTLIGPQLFRLLTRITGTEKSEAGFLQHEFAPGVNLALRSELGPQG
jgi:hypothetical protein